MLEFDPYAYHGYPGGLDYPWKFDRPSEKERDRRWQAIRRSMARNHYDALIVSAPLGFMPIKPPHLMYISNYVPYSNRGTYLLFPLEGEPLLALSSVVGPQFIHCARETAWIREITSSPEPVQEIIRKIQAVKLDCGQLGLVGYRSGVLAASACEALRKNLPRASFPEATGALLEAINEVSRSSEEELAFLRKACQILDESFAAVCETLRPGVKECELWAALEGAVIRNGGWYGHFIIATSGPYPTFMRGPASQNRLEQGDVVMFEIDPVYAGVSPQTAFALSLGQPRAEVAKMFEFCDGLYTYAVAELEKGRLFADIEMDLVKRIQAAGLTPMTPQVHRYNMAVALPAGGRPLPGDYFTIHPNVANPDYTAGAKFGDMVRISQTGKVESLLRIPARLNIV